MNLIHWLTHTDAGLWTRIAIGLAIFGFLAITDLLKNGSAARRWREYSVLLLAVVAALSYGAINDQITSSISWEYFYYGKDLEHILGPPVPPNPLALHWQAAKVGFKATWSAGLIFGVVLLLANNPWRNLPRLKNRRLVKLLPLIIISAATFAILGGFLGYYGVLTPLAVDFQDMTRANIFRPKHFICTWGIHLGGYIGGFIGTFAAAGLVIRKRSKLRRPADASITIENPI